MEEFTSISQLITEIDRDAARSERFPVRFILTNSYQVWQRLLPALKARVDRVIRLSELCSREDVCPRFDALAVAVDVSDGGRCLLFPLAEVLRLFPSQADVLASLWAIESPGKGRVYIPILDLEDVFFSSVTGLARFERGTGPEIWKVLGGSEGIKLAIGSFPFSPAAATKVKGLRAYFELWENGGAENVALTTEFAPCIQSRTGRTQARAYRSAFEYVGEQLHLPETFQESWGNSEQWEWLAGAIGSAASLGQVAADRLNVSRYDPNQLFAGWRWLDEHDRWLLYLWSRLEAPGDSYLARVLPTAGTYIDLAEVVACGALGDDLEWKMLRERRQLLRDLCVGQLPLTFWRAYEGLSDPLEKLRALPGLSATEQDEIIRLVGQLLKEERARGTWLQFLELNYPELAYYLSSFPYADRQVCLYLRLYNESRVRDSYDRDLQDEAEKVAEQRALWTYPTRGSRLETLADPEVEVIWVDAMGIEWGGLLSELLRRNGLQVDVEAVRANLPTSTEFNKAWTADSSVSRELDNIAHHYDYSFPSSLRQEISAVGEIAERARAASSSHTAVVVTSDHGLTRFAGKRKKTKPPEGYQVGRWGRYAVRASAALGAAEPTNCWVNDGDKVVLAMHDRFVGAGRLSGEVHGGATLEESLVPVAIVRKTVAKRMPRFSLLTRRVRLNVRGEGQLLGETDWPASDLELVVAGFRLAGTNQGGNRWIFSMKDVRPGKHLGTVETNGIKVGDVEFEVSRGIVAGDLGL